MISYRIHKSLILGLASLLAIEPVRGRLIEPNSGVQASLRNDFIKIGDDMWETVRKAKDEEKHP